jgi:hypothetical protein
MKTCVALHAFVGVRRQVSLCAAAVLCMGFLRTSMLRTPRRSALQTRLSGVGHWGWRTARNMKAHTVAGRTEVCAAARMPVAHCWCVCVLVCSRRVLVSFGVGAILMLVGEARACPTHIQAWCAPPPLLLRQGGGNGSAGDVTMHEPNSRRWACRAAAGRSGCIWCGSGVRVRVVCGTPVFVHTRSAAQR